MRHSARWYRGASPGRAAAFSSSRHVTAFLSVLSACACVTLAGARAGAQPVLRLDLPFDEGEGKLVHDRRSQLTGELHNVSWVEGKRGRGLEFNGKARTDGVRSGSYVILPDTRTVPFFQSFDNGPFTIEVWIRPGSAGGMREILNTSRDEGPGYRLFLDGKCVFRSGTGYAAEGGVFWEVTSMPKDAPWNPVRLHEWNHIAVTRGGDGVVTLYVNGWQADRSTAPFRITSGSNALTIGAFLAGHAYGFQGAIDELKIYQGAKTAAEVLWDARGHLAVDVDGSLGESLWQEAARLTGFLVHKGAEDLAGDENAGVQTTALIGNDGSFLYLGLICDEPLTASLRSAAQVGDPGAVFEDDSLEIMLDADGDRADYCQFLVNATGRKAQCLWSQGGVVREPWGNDAWLAATAITEGKWTAEIAIPFAILDGEDRLSRTARINIARNRRASGEWEGSSLIKNGQYHRPDLFRRLPLGSANLGGRGAWRMGQPTVLPTVQDGESLRTTVGFDVENRSPDPRRVTVEHALALADGTMLRSAPRDVALDGHETESVRLVYRIASSGAADSFCLLTEDDRPVLMDRSKLGRIEFIPLRLEVVSPAYRNSIYATEQVHEIGVRVEVGRRAAETADVRVELKLTDEESRVVASRRLPDAGAEGTHFLPVGRLPYGKYRLTAELKRRDTVVARASETIRKLPPAPGTEVRIDGNGGLLLNGRPFLPIIWWEWGTDRSQPPQGIQETGADGLIFGVYRPNPGIPEHRWADTFNPAVLTGPLDYLHREGKFGVAYLMSGEGKIKKSLISKPSREFFAKELSLPVLAREAITEEINLLKDHPALLCYYLVDEPEAGGGWTPSLLRQAYETIRELDPYHPVFICNCGVSGMRQYAGCMDVMAPDLGYVAPLRGKILGETAMAKIPAGLEAGRRVGRGNKLLGLTLQTFNWAELGNSKSHRDDREPTFVEERCMHYLAIIHGARMLNYFIYDGPGGARHYPDLSIGLPYIIREVKALCPAVLSGEHVNGVTASSSAVHVLARQLRGSTYIIAANATPRRLHATVSLPSAKQGERFGVVSEQRTVTYGREGLTDDFGPYEVHVYTTDDTLPDLTPLEQIRSEVIEAGGMYSLDSP